MTNLTLAQLRIANVSRCTRWHKNGIDDWSLSDWGVAMAGEAGETCNVIKKINRARDEMVGNKEDIDELRLMLANELADTLIYIDLLAARAGINLEAAVVTKFNDVSIKHGFPERLS